MFWKRQSGFTLIEAVIYLALFAILFAGAVVCAYSILETSGKNNTQAMMQEEGEFLLAKINWAVANASAAQVPAAGRLSATVYDNDLVFEAAGSDLVQKKYDDLGALVSEQPLNSSAVRIKNLFFIDISGGRGVKGISYGFRLESNAPNGMVLNSNFESTAYLLK